MGTGQDASIKEEDLLAVQAEVNNIAKLKQKFERMVVTKEEALDLFRGNPFKEAIITTKIPDGTRTTVYKCGDLIDLCRGPHITHTGKVKAFSTTQHSSTNWLGDTKRDSLQRIYGISFPDKKALKTWKENIEKVRIVPTWFVALLTCFRGLFILTCLTLFSRPKSVTIAILCRSRSSLCFTISVQDQPFGFHMVLVFTTSSLILSDNIIGIVALMKS